MSKDNHKMHKEKIIKEDGRYLIFYNFGNNISEKKQNKIAEKEKK